MVVINGHEWAPALYNYGTGQIGSTLMSEYSLRYIIKNKQQFLDLTDYDINGPLKLKNFTNLGTLDCSSERKLNPLTKYYNDDSRNNITILDLSECSGLKKLNCSGNKELTELNIRNCSNLTNINVIGCHSLRKVICDNSLYSSTEIIEKTKMSFCTYTGCREVAGHCDMHRMHYCKEEGCDSQIYVSQEYCSYHRSSCIISGCSFRTSSPYNYCAYHKKEREIEQERERKRAQEQERERKRAQEQERERKRDQLLHEKNQLQEQIAAKEDVLMQLINSSKSELVSKSMFSVKRKEKEAAYQNYLDSLLTVQKQFAQQMPKQIQLEQQAKKHLSKKLSEEKIQSLCQTQMELTKLEVNLAELEKKLLQIQIK